MLELSRNLSYKDLRYQVYTVHSSVSNIYSSFFAPRCELWFLCDGSW